MFIRYMRQKLWEYSTKTTFCSLMQMVNINTCKYRNYALFLWRCIFKKLWEISKKRLKSGNSRKKGKLNDSCLVLMCVDSLCGIFILSDKALNDSSYKVVRVSSWSGFWMVLIVSIMTPLLLHQKTCTHKYTHTVRGRERERERFSDGKKNEMTVNTSLA